MGADSTNTRHARRPPRLLLLVFAASLALNSQIAQGTVNAVGDADQTLANYFAQQNRLVGPDAVIAGVPTMADTASAVVSQVDAQLHQMVTAGASAASGTADEASSSAVLLRIKVHAADGTVLFSDEASLRGRTWPTTT